ncbi:hypothetical protein [Haladaptatus sp. DYSN1]|uniref:hypothetical protein n=1 Tax=unclassified Haladaptatus TaxID=2622732 RepID=UPI002406EC16|nr:hypothetical protein [Haladaptatus sp. DYSN1]
MTETIPVAVPRKGRPLEAVLERLAARTRELDETAPFDDVADHVISTLRYEKAITKGNQSTDETVYERLASYSDLAADEAPEFTLLRDDREAMPRRIVFDSVTVPVGDVEVQLVGREEPFRALRKHEFALGFDSADLVLEEVVELREEPLASIADLNARISPRDTDVRVVTGLGDTVYHTLLVHPEMREAIPDVPLGHEFVEAHEGPLCISPRYERLVEAILGTEAIEDVTFCYPNESEEEEAAIADVGLGVYLTVTGSTAREYGLQLGEQLFPSETVLLENHKEATTEAARKAKALFEAPKLDTELSV